MQTDGRTVRETIERLAATCDGGSVLVLGDMMLEQTVDGTSTRLAPDAPIPVVLVGEESDVPGGAANVAHNLARLGSRVVAYGFTGVDAEAERLRLLLAAAGVEDRLHQLAGWPTIRKTRVRCQGELLVRLDRERIFTPERAARAELLERLLEGLTDAAALVISDYCKGTVAAECSARVIAAARRRSIPVFVDSRGHDFSVFRGATGVFPNAAELARAAEIDPANLPSLLDAANRVLSELQLKFVLLKRDRDGMCLVTRRGKRFYPATATHVRDVSGAGDTALAAAVRGLQIGLTLEQSVHISAVAAGLAVGRVGTTAIHREELCAALTAFTDQGCIPRQA